MPIKSEHLLDEGLLKLQLQKFVSKYSFHSFCFKVVHNESGKELFSTDSCRTNLPTDFIEQIDSMHTKQPRHIFFHQIESIELNGTKKQYILIDFQRADLIFKGCFFFPEHFISNKQHIDRVLLSYEELVFAGSLNDYQYFNIFNFSDNLIFVKNEHFQYIFVNKAFLDHYGFSLDDILGQNDFDFISEDEAEQIRDVDLEIIKSDHQKTFIQRRNQRVFRVKKARILLAESVYGIWGEIEDITKQHETQQELVASHNKYKKILNGILNGIAVHKIIVDSNGAPVDYEFVEVNSAFEKQTGLNSDQVIGKRITQIIPSILKDTFKWVKEYGKVALTGSEITFEQYSESFGRWYKVHAFSTKKGFFTTVVEDISQQKSAEEMIHSTEIRMKAIIRVLQYQTESIQSFLRYALNEAMSVTESKYGYIYIFDIEKKTFILNNWSKEVIADCEVSKQETNVSLHKTGLWGDVVRLRKTIIDNDFSLPNLRKKGTPSGHVSIEKYLAIPVFSNGEIVATVGVANKKKDYNTTDELHLKLLMDSVWRVVESKKQVGEVEKVKSVQENLAESLQLSPLGMMYWKYKDGVSEIEQWNHSAENIFGWTFKEMIGKSFLDVLYYPDDIDEAHKRIQNLKKTRKSYHFENKCYTKDGKILTIKWFVTFIKTSNDGTMYCMSLAENFTQIRRYQKDLEFTKKQLEYALDGSRSGSWDWYMDTDQLHVNSRWMSIFGFTEDEIHNSGFYSKMDFWRSRFHPEDVNLCRMKTRQHVEGQTHFFQCEYRVKHKDDKWIWISDRGQITERDSNGNPVRMTGTIMNITQRKEMTLDLEVRNTLANVFAENSETTVFDALLEVILDYTRSKYGAIGYIDENENLVFKSVSHGINEHKEDEKGSFTLSAEVWQKKSWGIDLKAQTKHHVLRKHKLLEDWKTMLSSITMPITHNERLIGFFIVTDPEYKHTSSEMFYVQTLSDRVSHLFYNTLQSIFNHQKRLKAEDSLRLSEEKLELALDASNIGSWDWDLIEGKLLFDHRFASILGYSIEELNRKKISAWSTITHPDDLENGRRAYQKLLLGLKPYYVEDVRYQKKDGSWVWVTKRGKFTAHNKDGKPIRMTGTIIDISQRKVAEMNAELQKEELEWLVIKHQELLTKSSLDELYPYITKTLSEKIPNSIVFLMQTNPEQDTLISKNYSTSMSSLNEKLMQYFFTRLSRERIRIKEDNKSILQSRTVIAIPNKLILETIGIFSKSIIQVLKKLTNVKTTYTIGLSGNKGHFGNLFILTTGKKDLENLHTLDSFAFKSSLVLERILLEEEEKQNKKRLEQVAEQSKTIIWEIDKSGLVTYISPYIKDLLGYRPDEILHQVNWYDLHTNSEKEKIRNLLEQQMAQRAPFENVLTELNTKEGEVLSVSSNGVPILFNGTVVGFRGSDYDISIFKDMDRAKNEFINTVSHEMRTPLTVIKEATSILDMGDVTKEQRNVLNISKNNINRLSRIINDVLDYQKLQAKKVELSYEAVNLEDFFTEIKDAYTPVASKKNLQLEISIPLKDPVISIDSDKLYEVFGNLIDNAIKYTDEGSVTIKAQEKEKQWIEFRVIDTGKGIEKKEIPKLFRVFSQTSGVVNRRSGSTGLGLAICKEIVDLFNGTINVESTVGKGTTFIIRLPKSK